MAFNGFPKDFFTFFNELEENNNRDWFTENKSRYEDNVAGPCLDFIESFAAPLKSISPHFNAIPKKVGGSMFRIYRDTRFSKDKTPYKTNAGLHFRHALGKNAHAPGFYFHLSPDEVFVGAGLWGPDSKALGQIRNHIDTHQKKWLEIKVDEKFKTRFGGALHGAQSLKRPPKGFEADHPLIDDLKKKSFFVLAPLKPKDIHDPSILEKVTDICRDAVPVTKFLCQAVQAPF